MSIFPDEPLRDRTPSSAENPTQHTQKLKTQMRELIEHLRKDVGEVTEPKAQALFETAAEVIAGLVNAFDDYDTKREAAWRSQSAPPHPNERLSHAAGR